MIGKRIKELIDNQGFSAEEFSALLGISRGTAYSIFSKESVDTKYLVQLSEHFNVPITYFFEDSPKVSVSGSQNTTAVAGKNAKAVGGGEAKAVCKDAILLERLLVERERLLEEKDNVIQTQKKFIEVLTGRS